MNYKADLNVIFFAKYVYTCLLSHYPYLPLLCLASQSDDVENARWEKWSMLVCAPLVQTADIEHARACMEWFFRKITCIARITTIDKMILSCVLICVRMRPWQFDRYRKWVHCTYTYISRSKLTTYIYIRTDSFVCEWAWQCNKMASPSTVGLPGSHRAVLVLLLLSLSLLSTQAQDSLPCTTTRLPSDIFARCSNINLAALKSDPAALFGQDVSEYTQLWACNYVVVVAVLCTMQS